MSLGQELRDTRERKGLGLREVAGRAGVTHGYLSQLERDEISEPAPSMLHKLAGGYGEPFALLMRWAGYLETGTLSANQERALNYMGEDLTDAELHAIKAVLDAIRGRRAGFSQFRSLDAPLSSHDKTVIRSHAEALLRAAAVYGVVPTPVEELMRVSQLVSSGEIYLDVEERRRLRETFGSLVDVVLRKLQGVIHFRSREVWINPDIPEQRQRFVQSHEIGHHMLPWHHDLFAYLDDESRLRADQRDRYEREANQAAIELLAHGDRLRQEADDWELTFEVIGRLAQRYALSMQATARRAVEESRREYALIIAFRGSFTGKLMPHVYASVSFEHRFPWVGSSYRDKDMQAVLASLASDDLHEPIAVNDLNGRLAMLRAESLDTRRARLVLLTPARHRLLRLSLSRLARVAV